MFDGILNKKVFYEKLREKGLTESETNQQWDRLTKLFQYTLMLQIYDQLDDKEKTRIMSGLDITKLGDAQVFFKKIGEYFEAHKEKFDRLKVLKKSAQEAYDMFAEGVGEKGGG